MMMSSSGTEILISNECIELISENQGRPHASKVSGFMENAAPSVVTKYINTNKMHSHVVKTSDGRRLLYETSIFKTALAIKTGKEVQGNASTTPKNDSEIDSTSTKTVKTDACNKPTSKRAIRRMKRNMVISSDSSSSTATSSLSTTGSDSCMMTHESNPVDSITLMQRRQRRGCADEKADGVNAEDDKDTSFDRMNSENGVANAYDMSTEDFMRMNAERMSNGSFKQGTDIVKHQHKDMYHSVAAPPLPSPYKLISLSKLLLK
eukprot:scaffold19816_cov56-Cyclotella_meneghiniana.AAC.2